MSQDAKRKEILSKVGEDRREFVRKLITGVFVTPLVASFSMEGLTVSAHAQSFGSNTIVIVPNQTPGPPQLSNQTGPCGRNPFYTATSNDSKARQILRWIFGCGGGTSTNP